MKVQESTWVHATSGEVAIERKDRRDGLLAILQPGDATRYSLWTVGPTTYAFIVGTEFNGSCRLVLIQRQPTLLGERATMTITCHEGARPDYEGAIAEAMVRAVCNETVTLPECLVSRHRRRLVPA